MTSSGETARPAPDDTPRQIGELVSELSAGMDAASGTESADPRGRARLMGRLVQALAGGARSAGARGVVGGRWLTEVFATEVVPRLRVRDLETLRRHHNGRSGEALADALVANAARSTAAVGAAGGALAAVQFAAPPLLLSVPAQLVAETLVVAATEVRLIGELHVAYGAPMPGSGTGRMPALALAWANRRGIDPLAPGSFTLALGGAAKAALRRRLLRTFGRHFTTLGPLLTGAVAGGALNRTATRSLAEAVRHDLRKRTPRAAGPHSLPGR